MTRTCDYVRLDGGGATLVFAIAKGAGADCTYCGALLPADEDLASLANAQARGGHESQPDTVPVPGLLAARAGGWTGTSALVVRGLDAKAPTLIEADLKVVSWDAAPQAINITYTDAAATMQLTQSWRISPLGVALVNCTLTNISGSSFQLERMASLSLPVPMRFDHVVSYCGRWSREMQEDRAAITPHGFIKQSMNGKPGFGGNWLRLGSEHSDDVFAAHLAWSGDFETRIDCDAAGKGDGRSVLQFAAQLSADEIRIDPGESFSTPEAVFACADDRSRLAQLLHAHVRANCLPFNAGKSQRKVHINSWDAIGFDLSQSALQELADDAAAIGVERFVLDDGWFAGRRDTSSSLGDWRVCPDLFPHGLNPLIEYVRALGMDFGIWVEPEMISPYSDLYRTHPDWCLHLEGHPRPTMRGQLVLDLTRDEVIDAIFEQINALLNAHDIAYLKWDHNRDLFPIKARHRQVVGFYRLIDRIRAAHPHVEIESCAEGGGRIDYAILQRASRVWPSDNNDPIERYPIMRNWSQFVPLEVLGNHVGPSPNPITGRTTDMDFRAKIALFGHMGVEADPREMNAAERQTLAAHIAIYKQWRGVLHCGQLWRIEHPDPGVSGLMVTHDGSALALVAQVGFAAQFDLPQIRFAGLDAQARYRVTLPEPWPLKASSYLAQTEPWRDGLVLSGAALMAQGLALPLTHPETAWLVAFEKVT